MVASDSFAVVQGPLRQDPNDHIIVEVHGVSAGCRHIAASPAYDLPRASAEVMLAFD
jgi:hypothetical protein